MVWVAKWTNFGKTENKFATQCDARTKEICDAHYFLSQLSALGNERSQFTSNLGAFLAAARSALNYARKEAKRKSGSHTWFNHQTADKPVVDFDRAVERSPCGISEP
jgi:hypothetical protein